ncbi:MAG: D-alanyl-D-alanine endopeptidase [Burkholderiales bacterium]
MNKKTSLLAACVLGAFALSVLPAVAHAVEGKSRVRVKYSVKSSAHKSPRVHRVHPAHRVASARHHEEPVTINGSPNLKSSAALIVDVADGNTIYGKNTQNKSPIASITKLMTSMVVLDANLPPEETIFIDAADYDSIKHTASRLGMGTGLPRRDMLRLALMSSENRAANSLSRAYPGGTPAFVAAMNRKAVELGMRHTKFVDPTGLSSENVSTAEDLVKMVRGAYEYPLIREFTTTSAHGVETANGRSLQFRNSNGLVRDSNSTWDIGLSKTGYISEAGRCLVMQARIAARPVIIILLDSLGKQTRIGDANRIKKWLETRIERKPVG